MPRETVSDILKRVFVGSNFKCLEFEKRAVDADSASEYSEHDERIKGEIFENPRLTSFRDVRTAAITETTPSIISYFMDGSRRVFRFSDVVLENGKYFPVLAGQTGVAVLRRNPDGTLSPMLPYSRWENVLVLPDAIGKDDRLAIETAMRESGRFSFTVTDYVTGKSGGNQSDDYVTSATKKILDKMHDNEIWAVKAMMSDCVLRGDAMLMIDGSLQFRSDVLKRNDFQVNQLVNVVGVSKSFTPSQPVHGMKGGRHLGAVLQEMKFGQRTPVFKAGYGDFEKILGVWYLRIRQPGQMTTPLAGVLKIEVLANGAEEEDGLEADRVNSLSAMILSERNVTPFGADDRWANHLYPVYLTEKYLKSRFLSDVYFKGLL
jgi:hypothetical protein